MNEKQSPTEKLDRYIRARYPVVMIASHEESRVQNSIKELSYERERQLVTWCVTQGLKADRHTQELNIDSDGTRDPMAALQAVLEYAADNDATLFLLKDLHGFLTDPMIVRYIRDIGLKFETCRHTLILLSPVWQIPPDLEKQVVVLDWPLPEEKELEAILMQCEKDLPSDIPVKLNGDRSEVVQAMRGLTEFEATSVLLSAIAATGELGEQVIPHIVGEKRQIIRKSGVLEFYDETVTMSDVGGLPYLKEYAARKRAAFTPEAKDFGVDAPKGVLLVGVPGTGKSLSAKAIAGGKMPLLRMDIGALMGSLVGQSEANMRSALKVAEAVAPCVLWVDEIEKGLGGTGGEMDGGTSMRVFGTLLTWMQETPAPVYVIATANEVRALRPELLRRFDDLFFVDLPNSEDRAEIVNIHLAKRGRDQLPNTVNERVAAATWGFTGAEIEKVVKTALETAFYNNRDLANSDLLAAADSIVPISKTMGENISNLRAWAGNRALPAGQPLENKKAMEGKRTIES